MGRSVLKLKRNTPEQIKEIIDSNSDYGIGIKLYAIYQVSKGQPSRKLEDLYHTSFKQILNWVHRFEEDGVEGLKHKEGQGRKPKLGQTQLQQLKHLIANSPPHEHGYNTSTWTGALVRHWVEHNFGVVYQKAQIYNVLRSLGFSFQKGRGIYAEADKEKQQEFVEGLKKNPGRPK